MQIRTDHIGSAPGALPGIAFTGCALTGASQPREPPPARVAA